MRKVFFHSSWQCGVSKVFLQLADMGMMCSDSTAGLPAAVEDHSYLQAEQLTLH